MISYHCQSHLHSLHHTSILTFPSSVHIETHSKTMEAVAKELKIQGDIVRELKADKSCPKADLEAALEKLKQLKLQLKEFTDLDEADRKAKAVFRAGLEDLLLRKFFYVPSFEIYGGVGGLYDYGPPGTCLCLGLHLNELQYADISQYLIIFPCTILLPQVVLSCLTFNLTGDNTSSSPSPCSRCLVLP